MSSSFEWTVPPVAVAPWTPVPAANATALAVPTLRAATDRLGELMTAWIRFLPYRLRCVLPHDMVGYAILGAVTFGIAIGLLVMLEHWTLLPLVAAVVLADGAAWVLNFLLNRFLNFRSRAPIGRQTLRYGVVVVADFLTSAGVTTGLSDLGMNLTLSRLIAGGCIAVLGYAAYRWWVFR